MNREYGYNFSEMTSKDLQTSYIKLFYATSNPVDQNGFVSDLRSILDNCGPQNICDTTYTYYIQSIAVQTNDQVSFKLMLLSFV